MFNELELMCDIWANKRSNQGHDLLHILLGKQPENITFDEMFQVWQSYKQNIQECEYRQTLSKSALSVLSGVILTS